jgi:hypothetical protein
MTDLKIVKVFLDMSLNLKEMELLVIIITMKISMDNLYHMRMKILILTGVVKLLLKRSIMKISPLDGKVILKLRLTELINCPLFQMMVLKFGSMEIKCLLIIWELCKIKIKHGWKLCMLKMMLDHL